MKKLWQAFAYLKYRITAKSRYKIHSPFVYSLVEKVFRDNSSYDDYRKLKKVYHRYRRRTDRIETMDFGSGAGDNEYVIKTTTVGKVVRQRTHTISQLQLLYRMSRYFQPDTILEFGTAAGISTLYLGKGSPGSHIITMEGCVGLASVSRKSFKKRHVNAKVEVGDFDAVLEYVLPKITGLNMVFFDGNHRMEPTVRYFEKCLPFAGEESVFMFDDIHWSPGMDEAWQDIKKHEKVSITIDLYWVGLVFFRKGVAKQDFVIRY